MKQHGLRPVSPFGRKVLELLVEGLDEPGASREIDKAGGAYMAVCVERVEETEYGPIYSVAHYYHQAGDLVPDPDVTLLATKGDFFPLSYQDGLVYRLSAEFTTDGDIRVDRDQQEDLAHFVGDWMRNIKAQQGL